MHLSAVPSKSICYHVTNNYYGGNMIGRILLGSALLGGSMYAAAPLLVTTASAEPAPVVTAAPTHATVIRIIDGDTIRTSRGTVRFIGMNAPEIKEKCGLGAKQHLDGLIGSTVELRRDDNVRNRDRYGRYLRYVVVNGEDIGYQMIKDNWAVAKYDSKDGWARHANETQYRAASRPVVCSLPKQEAPPTEAPAPQPAPVVVPAPVPVVAPIPVPVPVAPVPAPAPVVAPVSDEPWNRPVSPTNPDLDCDDIKAMVGHRVSVDSNDYHGLDRDADGTGCDALPVA